MFCPQVASRVTLVCFTCGIRCQESDSPFLTSSASCTYNASASVSVAHAFTHDRCVCVCDWCLPLHNVTMSVSGHLFPHCTSFKGKQDVSLCGRKALTRSACGRVNHRNSFRILAISLTIVVPCMISFDV